MTPFTAPLDDILFSLEHVAQARTIPDWDSDLAAQIARHFAQFAESEIAPLNAPGDRQGCRLQNGRVRTPDGYPQAFRRYADQGWCGLTLPEAFGGQGLPGAMASALLGEITTGACPGFAMATGLIKGAAQTLLVSGSAEQQARYLPRLASGAWTATMCLSEPGAGSDLSGVRTKAVAEGDGWAIRGEKIFISGGDHDLSEGILHLVLARTGEMSEGLKGLSLFLCPSQDDAGNRNAISVTRLEEKMGLHGSPTCQLRFDGARAELIGEPGKGLLGMFTMMNSARIGTSLLGVAHAARATDIATRYAAERQQGGVTIDRHPDVARMLREMDALTLGMRAMSHLLLVALTDPGRADLVDFLTPVCKVFCTEGAIEASNAAIQVLGGYGYLQEYQAEQNLRDVRIAAIFEGANGIHASTLTTRLLRLKEGKLAEAFAVFVAGLAAQSPDGAALAAALEVWNGARAALLGSDRPRESAHAFMQLTGTLLFLAAWHRLYAVSGHAADPARLERLYHHVRRTCDAKIVYWASLCG